MAKYCSNCGREYDNRYVRCSYCNYELISIIDFEKLSLKEFKAESKIIPRKVKNQVLARDKSQCIRCGKDTKNVSYILSLFEGGNDDISNIGTICNDCLEVKYESRKKYHQLNRLDDDLLSLIFFKSDIPEFFISREEKIIYICENVDDIGSLINEMKYRFDFIDALNDLGDFDEKELPIEIPPSLIDFNDKVYYLVLHCSIDELEFLAKYNPDLKGITDSLNSLEDRIFNFVSKIFSVSKSSKKEVIDELVSNYSSEEIEDEISFAKLRFEIYDELLALDDKAFDYLIEDFDLDDGLSKEESIEFILSNYKNYKDYDGLAKIKLIIAESSDKASIFDRIYNLSDKAFDFYMHKLLISYNKGREYRELLAVSEKAYKIDQLFLFYSKKLLVDLIDYVEKNIKKYLLLENFNINELDNILNSLQGNKANFVNKSVSKVDEDLKYEKIIFIVDNYNLKEIILATDIINQKTDLINRLKEYDDRFFKYVFIILSLNERFYSIPPYIDIFEEELNYLISKDIFDSSFNEFKKDTFDYSSLEDDYIKFPYIDIVTDKLIVNTLSTEFDEESKDLMINLLFNIYNSNQIIKAVSAAEEKINYASEIYNLDDGLFNHLCDTLINDSVFANVIWPDFSLIRLIKTDFIVLKYSKEFIQETIQSKAKREKFYKKLDGLNDKVFYYLSYLLKTPDFDNKASKINYILDKNSFNGINRALNKAFSKLETFNKVMELDSNLLNSLFDILDIPPSLYLEDRCDYLVLNYEEDQIFKEIDNVKEKKALIDRLSKYDDRKLKYIFHFFGAKEGSDDKKIRNIVNNNSKKDIEKIIRKANTQIKFAMALEEIVPDYFNFIANHYGADSSLSLEEKSDYLILNYGKSEINKFMRSVNDKVPFIFKLNDWDDRRLKYLSSVLHISKESKEDLIDYIICNYAYDDINEAISNTEKLLIYASYIESLDGRVFDLLCNKSKVPSNYSKREKVDYLVLNHSETRINEEINTIKHKFEIYDEIIRYEGKKLDYLYHYLNPKGDSKEDKINYILEYYGPTRIENTIRIINDKIELYAYIKNIEEDLFDELIIVLDIPLDSMGKEAKLDYLTLNYSINDIENHLALARKRINYFKKLDGLSDKTFDYLCHDLNVLDSSKEYKIKSILKKYGYLAIDNAISNAESKFEYSLYLDSLDSNIFDLLCKSLSVSKSFSKEEKIDYLVLNMDLKKLDKEIEEAEKRLDYFNKIDSLKENEFSYLKSILLVNKLKDKSDEINFILDNYDFNSIDNALLNVRVKADYEKELRDLDDKTFDLLSKELGLDLLKTKENRIHQIVLNNEISFINMHIRKINERLRLSDKIIKNLNDYVFNYLMKIYNISDDLPKENKAYALVLKNSCDEIKRNISLAKDRFKEFNKLSKLSDKLFAYLKSLLLDYEFIEDFKEDISPTSASSGGSIKVTIKEEKSSNGLLNNILNINDKYIISTNDSNHLFNEHNDFKTTSSETLDLTELKNNSSRLDLNQLNKLSKEEQIDCLIDNFSKEEIDAGINLSKRKIRYFNTIDSLDNNAFAILTLSIDLSSGINKKEDKIDYIVLNNSNQTLSDKIAYSNNRMEVFERLDNLSDKEFNYLTKILDIKSSEIHFDSSYGLSDKETVMDYILLNKQGEIFEALNKAKIKSNIFNKINNLSKYNYVIFALTMDGFDFKLSKEEQIDYFVFNSSKEEIDSNINLSNAKMGILNKLLKLSDRELNFVYENLDINKEIPDVFDLNLKEIKTLLMVLNRDEDEINKAIDFALRKSTLIDTIDNLKPIAFELLLKNLKISENDIRFKILSKEEKILFILSNYSFVDLDNEISKVNDLMNYTHILNSLTDIRFNILSNNLKVPKGGYHIGGEESAYDDNKSPREDKINYMILNYSLSYIKDEITIIEDILKIFDKLNNNENKIIAYIGDSLDYDKSTIDDNIGSDKKELKIIYLFDNNSKELILKSIEIANERIDFAKELTFLRTDVFDLLALNYKINNLHSRDEKIDNLVLNYKKDEIKGEISFIRGHIALFDEIFNYKDNKFILLCLELKVPQQDLKEENILYMLKNNSSDEINKAINKINDKLGLYDKIIILKKRFFDLFVSRFDLDSDSVIAIGPDGVAVESNAYGVVSNIKGGIINLDNKTKEDTLFLIISKYDFDRIKKEHEFVLDKIELSNNYFDKISGLSDKYFNQFIVKFESNDLKDKEDKIFNILFNNDESKINNELSVVIYKEKVFDKLDNYKEWELKHLSDLLNVYKSTNTTRESFIDSIIENKSQNEIDDAIKKTDIRIHNFNTLNEIDDKVLVAIYHEFKASSYYESKEDKINYLLDNFTMNAIEEKIPSFSRDVSSISNKLSEDKELANYIFEYFTVPLDYEFEDQLIDLFGGNSLSKISNRIRIHKASSKGKSVIRSILSDLKDRI